MNYGLKKPCKTCPFVKAHDFPLTPARIEEIAQAEGFPCHNTVDYESGSYDDEEWDGAASETRDRSGEHQCFGHLVVQWAEYRGFDTMAAFAARAGMFKPEELPSPEESGCFASFGEYADRERERFGSHE